jgi:hypothetical protein
LSGFLIDARLPGLCSGFDSLGLSAGNCSCFGALWRRRGLFVHYRFRLVRWSIEAKDTRLAPAGVAWVTALTNVTTWCAATFFGPEAAEEVFRGAKPARVTGVLSPRKAVVKRVEDGYLIEEGMWGFNSGIYHATWDMLGIPLVDAGAGCGKVPLLRKCAAVQRAIKSPRDAFIRRVLKLARPLPPALHENFYPRRFFH